MGNCIVTPPSRVAVISGPAESRMVIGRCAFKRWLTERVEYLSLELITLNVKSVEAETVRGVRVSVSGTCQVKVDAFSGDSAKQNMSQITLACQHFLGKSSTEIHDALLQTLEGHQRQILGTLTVEELYRDRAAFSQRIREHIQDDLRNMGFALVSYTVNQVTDSEGYMQALGARQMALVKREAAEGRSKNESEGKQRVAEYESAAKITEATCRTDAHVQVTSEEERKAAADRDLQIKRAAYKAEVNAAEAQAAVAFDIEKAKQGQEVVREETKQQAEKAKVLLDVQDTEALRVQKQKEGISLAMLIEERNKAEATRAAADAKAYQIREVGQAEAAAKAYEIKETGQAEASARAFQVKEIGEAEAAARALQIHEIGQAEASAILAKGEAEAKVLELRGDSFQHFGQAAVVQSIVDRLPELAKEIAAPLAKTDKMVFISGENGGAGSRLTSDVSSILSQLPTTVEALTGVDITKGLERYVGAGASNGPNKDDSDPKLLSGLRTARKR